MRNYFQIVLIVILSMVFSTVSMSQGIWSAQNSGTTMDLYSIYNSQNGNWAVGAQGIILFTSNSGNTWNPQTSGTTNDLTDVVVFNNSDGPAWIVGKGGTILKSTDLGITWTAVSSPTTADLYSVSFSDTSRGWISGAGGIVLQTVDGGNQWNIEDVGTSVNLNSIQFLKGSFFFLFGWVVGDAGVIKYTNDAGATPWMSQQSNTTNNLNAVFFRNSDRGLSVGSNGFITRTTDGGVTWQTKNSGVTVDLEDVYTVGSEGWAVGDSGEILHTINSGDLWLQQSSGTMARLRSIAYQDLNHIWVVGDGGKILFGGTSSQFVVVTSPDGGEEWTVGEQRTITWISDNIDSIKIEYSTNNGTSWSVIINSVFAKDESYEWIIPNTTSAQCLVRITDVTNSVVTDESNGTFSITPVTSVEDFTSGLPEEYALFQNYPNPFNPATNINFSIPTSGFVTLKVYNIQGKEVTTPVDGEFAAGNYQITFNGNGLASGMYFYKLTSESFTEVKKMILMK